MYTTSVEAEAEISIEDLDLPERPSNCLLKVKINTLSDLLERTPEDLLAITNFGEKSLDEVIAQA